MEAQIETLKQQLEDTRHQLLMVKLKMESVFSHDSDTFGTPLEVFETIERLYMLVWEGRKPSLEQINKYAQEKLKLCPSGSIMMNEDEDCDCPYCQELLENTCGNCDTYYHDECITHKTEALLCVECSIDKDGEPECPDGMNCEWCDVYREEYKDD